MRDIISNNSPLKRNYDDNTNRSTFVIIMYLEIRVKNNRARLEFECIKIVIIIMRRRKKTASL